MAQEKFLNHAGLQYYDEKLKDFLEVEYEASGTAATKVKELEDGQVKTNKEAIEKLNGDASTTGSVAKAIADAKALIDGDIDAVEGKVTTLIGEDTGKSVRAITLEEVAKILNDSDPSDIDTLEEIAAWIADHPESVAEINAKIKGNADAIAALATLVGTLPEGATATTVVGYVQEAVAAENTRADGLDERIQALEAIDHEHANKALLDTYTQTEANLADAVSKKHSHTNATVLNGITAEKVAAWDAAEGNAKTHANGLNTAMDTRVAALEGKVGDGFVAITNAEIDALFA